MAEPNSPNLPNPAQLAPTQSSVQQNQSDDMALIKLMLEQMQQDIAILKSKDASNHRASDNSQSQNLGSSNPVIQLGTVPTVPNCS